ncbi:hypothetical protein GQ43DRAFT_397801 [Delitschia confertaspora ATCC 74209]|uniref:Adipose-regulatory protein, Seipin n=1 Tax=Delitschia confertaspora ATCC 74209 TaxID=1513339 RepID=A0A9P4JKJ2_9PLEO|nr:hypothetical protein GQ43DRAFT_397801 [Delitschia confertaspora ATCC 74209]
MSEAEEEFEDRKPLSIIVKDTILSPIYFLTQPTLLRTYLHTTLLVITSIFLFALAVLAYTTFYYAYIPAHGLSVPLYLQFQHAPSSPHLVPRFPYAVANIVEKGGKGGLKSRQKYDVIVEMELPRSERNLEAGNWMLGLELRGPESVSETVKGALGWREEWDVDDFSWGESAGRVKESSAPRPGSSATTPIVGSNADVGIVLARSRRPAILTYRSRITELAYRMLRLPLYIAGFGHEAETVEVRMMEGVEFERGWRNTPSLLRLEVRSKGPLEVYTARVRFVARFEGLRYIMYNYRILSLLVFTTLFWSVEITLLLLTWGAITFLFSEPSGPLSPENLKIKDENEHEPSTPKTEPTSDNSGPTTPMSDTSRTFPTLPSHAPLHYSSSQSQSFHIKHEPMTSELKDFPPLPSLKTEDADDEDDEDADFVMEGPRAGLGHDSGIGTSMESSVEGSGRRGRGELIKRRSGGFDRQ